MPAAAIGVVATAYAANQQKKAAQGAANAQGRAYDAATAENARQYDRSRQDNMPWLQAGQGALERLGAASNGDFSSFKQSPGYQWNVDQQMQSLDRSAAAHGGLYSGGADADRMRYANGLASQEYGNWWNQQAGLAGLGQVTATNLGSLGQNYANTNANLLTGAADARASAYGQKAYANNMLAGSIANFGLNALGRSGWGS